MKLAAQSTQRMMLPLLFSHLYSALRGWIRKGVRGNPLCEVSKAFLMERSVFLPTGNSHTLSRR